MEDARKEWYQSGAVHVYLVEGMRPSHLAICESVQLRSILYPFKHVGNYCLGGSGC
jgi:hypothetical protein